MKRTLLLLLAVNYLLGASGQSNTFFPSMIKVELEGDSNSIFGYDKNSTRLVNKPCYLVSKSDPLHCEKDDFEYGNDMVFIVAKFKSPGFKDSLTITFTEGISDDPEFLVTTKENKTIGAMSCTGFYINSSGTIYTSGHVNNMYDRRRKFQIQKDTIIEIMQSFNYVGLKGKALRDFVLYKEKNGKEIVAHIPKGYDVEVLLGEAGAKDYEMSYLFLVKTDFGLVGWLRHEGGAERFIEGLYFAGD